MTDLYPLRLKKRHRERIEEYVRKGEYGSIAEFIHEAISHHLRYLYERDFRLYVQSEKGETRAREIAESELEERIDKE